MQNALQVTQAMVGNSFTMKLRNMANINVFVMLFEQNYNDNQFKHNLFACVVVVVMQYRNINNNNKNVKENVKKI